MHEFNDVSLTLAIMASIVDGGVATPGLRDDVG
jgi:hypothetical protein